MRPSNNAENLNDKASDSLVQSENSQKPAKPAAEPPSKSKSKLKSSAKPPKVGSKSVVKPARGQKTTIKEFERQIRKIAPLDQVEEKFQILPNQRHDSGQPQALRCHSFASEIFDHFKVFKNDGPYSPESFQTNKTPDSSGSIVRASSPADNIEQATQPFKVQSDTEDFEEPQMASSVVSFGSRKSTFSEDDSVFQAVYDISSKSSSMSTENVSKEVQNLEDGFLLKPEVESNAEEVEGHPAEITYSTDDEDKLITEFESSLEITDGHTSKVQEQLDNVETLDESQSDEESTKQTVEELEDNSKQIYLDTISPDDSSLSDIDVEAIQTLTTKTGDVSSDSESEGSSEEFTMDDFTLVQSDSSESDYEQETVLYEMPARLRRITELTEITENSNRSSFRSVIEEEPQSKEDDLVELDSTQIDVELLARETLDYIIGDALMESLPEDKRDEGFVSSTDMLGSDDRLDQFDDAFFSPIAVPEIDHENRVLTTISDLCLFKSQYDKNVDQENQMKKDEQFDKIEAKANYPIWQNEEKLESFISNLESDQAAENDVLLPIKFVARNRQKGRLFINLLS